MEGAQPIGPLEHVKVLQIGTMLAAGHAGALLADFGAEVIQVEQPGVGDPLRQMGPFHQGKSLRWSVLARNKQSVTVDMHYPEGQQIVRDLAARVNVVIENFRPGKLEEWNLNYHQLREANPGIIMLSISGYGQTGPSRAKPGFGRVIEAYTGLMNSTGEPGGPPMQIGVPIVDYIAGTFGAMSVAMALHHQQNHPGAGGQWIDLSLAESIIRLIDPLITRYDKLGDVPDRTGNRYPNIAPSDVYRTRDGRHVFHSSATQSVFRRLMQAIGRTDLIDHPDFATNQQRIKRVHEVNDIVQEWFARHDFQEAVRIMEAHEVPVGPVNTMADLFSDPQVNGRGSLVTVEDAEYGPTRVPGLVPKFSETPGRIDHLGPALGVDTEQVLTGLLGYPRDRVGELRQRGIV